MKHMQTFSAKLEKCLEPVNDKFIVFFATAIFAILARSLGILP